MAAGFSRVLHAPLRPQRRLKAHTTAFFQIDCHCLEELDDDPVTNLDLGEIAYFISDFHRGTALRDLNGSRVLWIQLVDATQVSNNKAGKPA